MRHETEMEQELDENHIIEIQDEYRKRKLRESITGPVVSTSFHILLIIILGIYVADKSFPKTNQMQLTLLPEEEKKPLELKPIEPKIETKVTTEIVPKVAINVPDLKALTDNASIEKTDTPEPETPDFTDNNDVSEVLLSVSAKYDSSLKGGRTPSGIQGALRDFAPIKTPTMPAFIKCLEWLAKVQNTDGSWGDGAQPAYTGLALLTYLAHGETNTSKRYGNTVRKAMEWLVKDKIDIKSNHGYPHAIKTYALAEAYAMTGMSIIGEKMNECVEIIVKGQQNGGAFDYNYSADENRQDLSFAGWNYQALKAAMGAGCEVKGLADALYKSAEYLKIMAKSNKSFAYTTSNNDPATAKQAGKWTMVAVGTLTLQLIQPENSEILQDELEGIITEGAKRFNWNNPPHEALYGWYYETNAVFHAQGKYWKAWKEIYAKNIVENQHPEGYWIYPGNHVKIPGNELSHKVYATTLAALTLSVPFRYLPSSSAIKMAKTETKKPKPVIDEGINLVE